MIMFSCDNLQLAHLHPRLGQSLNARQRTQSGRLWGGLPHPRVRRLGRPSSSPKLGDAQRCTRNILMVLHCSTLAAPNRALRRQHIPAFASTENGAGGPTLKRCRCAMLTMSVSCPQCIRSRSLPRFSISSISAAHNHRLRAK